MIGSFDGTNTTSYLTDAEGSVLTSFSQSAVTGEQIHGPYGNTRYTAGMINTAKGYTGQIQDSVTGLDYDESLLAFRARGWYTHPRRCFVANTKGWCHAV